MPRARAQARNRVGIVRTPHSFVWVPGRQAWTCQSCGTAKRKGRSARDRRQCVPVDGGHARVHPSHVMHIAWDEAGVPVVYCRCCGLYATSRFDKLRGSCPPKARTSLALLLARKHPKGRRPLQGGGPLPRTTGGGAGGRAVAPLVCCAPSVGGPGDESVEYPAPPVPSAEGLPGGDLSQLAALPPRPTQDRDSEEEDPFGWGYWG